MSQIWHAIQRSVQHLSPAPRCLFHSQPGPLPPFPACMQGCGVFADRSLPSHISLEINAVGTCVVYHWTKKHRSWVTGSLTYMYRSRLKPKLLPPSRGKGAVAKRKQYKDMARVVGWVYFFRWPAVSRWMLGSRPRYSSCFRRSRVALVACRHRRRAKGGQYEQGSAIRGRRFLFSPPTYTRHV